MLPSTVAQEGCQGEAAKQINFLTEPTCTVYVCVGVYVHTVYTYIYIHICLPIIALCQVYVTVTGVRISINSTHCVSLSVSDSPRPQPRPFFPLPPSHPPRQTLSRPLFDLVRGPREQLRVLEPSGPLRHVSRQPVIERGGGSSTVPLFSPCSADTVAFAARSCSHYSRASRWRLAVASARLAVRSKRRRLCAAGVSGLFGGTW